MSKPWHPFYWGDFNRDTASLSNEEVGIYIRLLAEYYAHEKPLPANAGRLLRVCRTFAEEGEQALIAVLEGHFVLIDGVYHNLRADEEIAKSNKISNIRSAAGKKRQQNPSKLPANDVANDPANGLANDQQMLTQPQPQPHIKEKQTKERTDFVIEEVFGFWKGTFKLPEAKFDPDRQKAIWDALSLGYSPDKLKKAITGCSRSPWNMGRKAYALQTIMKNADSIEKFMDCADNPPASNGSNGSTEPRRQTETMPEWQKQNFPSSEAFEAEQARLATEELERRMK